MKIPLSFFFIFSEGMKFFFLPLLDIHSVVRTHRQYESVIRPHYKRKKNEGEDAIVKDLFSAKIQNIDYGVHHTNLLACIQT